MNREDIIRMAREAGISKPWDQEPVQWETLERFAALVAATEREKVARWQIGSGYATGHGDTIEDLLVELEWQVRESEREACAKVCEELGYYAKHGGWGCAAAIRERGAPDPLTKLNKAAEDNGEVL
jgi:hypothetical protein